MQDMHDKHAQTAQHALQVLGAMPSFAAAVTTSKSHSFTTTVLGSFA
jgi:hypothetical protein